LTLDKILDIPAPTKQIPPPISNRSLSFRFFFSPLSILLSFCWAKNFWRNERVEYISELNETAMSSLKQVYLNLTWSTDNAPFVSALIDRLPAIRVRRYGLELFPSIPAESIHWIGKFF
jgi:hypothetical protein